jgi:hypothetical protein
MIYIILGVPLFFFCTIPLMSAIFKEDKKYQINKTDVSVAVEYFEQNQQKIQNNLTFYYGKEKTLVIINNVICYLDKANIDNINKPKENDQRRIQTK